MNKYFQRKYDQSEHLMVKKVETYLPTLNFIQLKLIVQSV